MSAGCGSQGGTGTEDGPARSTTQSGSGAATSAAPTTGSPATSTAPGPPATSVATSEPHIPADPDSALVGCVARPAPTDEPSATFPFGALGRAEPLALGDPLRTAFEQATLRGGGGDPASREAPVVLDRRGDVVVVGNLDPPGLVAVMTRDDTRTGWEAGAASACPVNLPVVLPDGIAAVTWRLDPAAAAPGPADTTVHLWLDDDSCPGDTRLDHRLRPTEVVARDGQVLIGITADPPASGGGCSSSVAIPVPLTVELPQPLGDRVLADGLVLPPRAAT